MKSPGGELGFDSCTGILLRSLQFVVGFKSCFGFFLILTHCPFVTCYINPLSHIFISLHVVDRKARILCHTGARHPCARRVCQSRAITLSVYDRTLQYTGDSTARAQVRHLLYCSTLLWYTFRILKLKLDPIFNLLHSMPATYPSFRIPPLEMSRPVRAQIPVDVQARLEVQRFARLPFLRVLLHLSLDIVRATGALETLQR